MRQQAALASTFGITQAVLEELESYLESPFGIDAIAPETTLPLPDEPFVDCWQNWVDEAARDGALAVLQRHLPQFAFPIREGISETEAYRAATRKGLSPSQLEEATGLVVPQPERIEIELYASAAGRVPVIIARGRDEFEAVVRALVKRNEPATVPASQGAAMIAGYNNWARLHELRRSWAELAPTARQTATWREEFARIKLHKELFQDRIIVLSDGPYSAVPAAELGLSESRWRDLSLIIRRDHECTHYLTRRLFGSMRNNLLDELIADYCGLVAATGSYRADWQIRFLGLDEDSGVLPGARVEIYRGDPVLSDDAFRVVHHLVAAAARTLEDYHEAHPVDAEDLAAMALRVTALCSLRLDEMAAEDGGDMLRRAEKAASSRLSYRHQDTSSAPT